MKVKYSWTCFVLCIRYKCTNITYFAVGHGSSMGNGTDGEMLACVVSFGDENDDRSTSNASQLEESDPNSQNFTGIDS